MDLPDGAFERLLGCAPAQKEVTRKDVRGYETVFRRYEKLCSELIPLDQDGMDPPPSVINPDYKPQPSNPRKCISCGKMHDTIFEDQMTGERIHEIAQCKDCFFTRVFKFEP